MSWEISDKADESSRFNLSFSSPPAPADPDPDLAVDDDDDLVGSIDWATFDRPEAAVVAAAAIDADATAAAEPARSFACSTYDVSVAVVLVAALSSSPPRVGGAPLDAAAAADDGAGADGGGGGVVEAPVLMVETNEESGFKVVSASFDWCCSSGIAWWTGSSAAGR